MEKTARVLSRRACAAPAFAPVRRFAGPLRDRFFLFVGAAFTAMARPAA